MHPEDIKAEIRKRRLTLTKVAAAVSGRAGEAVTKGAVSRVLHGHFKSEAIARAISKAVGQPVANLWPGKYPELEREQAHAGSRVTSSSHVKAGHASRSTPPLQPASPRKRPAARQP